MATHSSILAWRIPWTEERGGLQVMGLQRIRHDRSNLAHTVLCLVFSSKQRLDSDAYFIRQLWRSRWDDACSSAYYSGWSQKFPINVSHNRKKILDFSLRAKPHSGLSSGLLSFSRWVVFNSLLQHVRLLCPPLSPGLCSNSHPLSRCCHPTIPSSVARFSFSPQSVPAAGSFPVSRLFATGGQSIGGSASASVLPVNIQGLFPLELVGLISLQSKGLSGVFSSTTIQKYQFFSAQPSMGYKWC